MLLFLCAVAIASCADQTTAPAADRGLGVVEAELDGVPWRSDGGAAGATFNPALGGTGLVIQGLRCVHCAPGAGVGPLFRRAGDTIETVRLVIDTIRGAGTYEIRDVTSPPAGRSSAVFSRTQFAGDITGAFAKKRELYAHATGEIAITLFDPFSGYVAGTFAFTAADSAGVAVRLSRGTFDLPLSSALPPIGTSGRAAVP